jgi:hypothetical protein
LQVGLDALDLGGARIRDARQAVIPQECELEVVPVLAEDRAVEAQVIVRPGGLSATSRDPTGPELGVNRASSKGAA